MRRFASAQDFDLPPERLFPFFADAFNLEEITPPFLRFRVVTEPPIRMETGARIEYRLRYRRVPVRWRTVIDEWEPPVRFVDRQERGPFRLWVHEHRFESLEGGRRTRMLDTVDYAAPGGRLVEWAVVDRDVRKIFAYRRRVLARRFGEPGVWTDDSE